MKDNRYIFISYAREDSGRVVALVKLFEDQGWSIWWDRDNLLTGKQLDKEIEQAIQGAACVLVCWSKDSIDADWVIAEAAEAIEQNKLMPVTLDRVKPPLRFRPYNAIDFSEWDERASHFAYQRLKNDLLRQYPQVATSNSPQQASNVEPVIPENIQRLINQLDDPETSPERRLEIGDELDNMEGGDPRFGTGLGGDGLPDINWVNIPAGKFIYGEKDGQMTLHLDTFEIARYPVTNAQFQAFVDDGGYSDERWWQGLKKPEIDASDWPQGNRPKINIDWFEATAFTRWLSYRLGLSITLPHETQWERAARGTSGQVYPWGNEYLSGYANVNETRIKDGSHNLEQTTGIGIYPHAKSPEGIQDLAGNVWEWCSNDYYNPTEKIDVPSSPVLRGGAWDYFPDYARAAFRYRFNPDNRNLFRGFRLLRSPPL